MQFMRHEILSNLCDLPPHLEMHFIYKLYNIKNIIHNGLNQKFYTDKVITVKVS